MPSEALVALDCSNECWKIKIQEVNFQEMLSRKNLKISKHLA
jgi:hypothetical protein